MSYPQWSYFPQNSRPAAWTADVVAAVADAHDSISTVDRATGLNSNAVLAELQPALTAAGFLIERRGPRTGKIPRPVLFGENGAPTLNYEVDGFQERDGVVLEVEAGRGARGNADYRDLVRTSLILDARHLALLLPAVYRFQAGGRQGVEHAYRNTRELLHAIYASQRLRLPFEGVLLVGY